jgi:hypothetical protein
MDILTKGCTVLSFVLRSLGFPVPGEYCCDEHDVGYDQGGSLWWKIQLDAKFYDCVKDGVNPVAAGLGWVAVTFNPYSYWVWFRAERGV